MVRVLCKMRTVKVVRCRMVDLCLRAGDVWLRAFRRGLITRV